VALQHAPRLTARMRPCSFEHRERLPQLPKVAEQLHEVDAFQELFVDKFEGTVWKTCARYSPTSLPSTVGLLKLIEVAAGLALPQTASIEICSSDTV